MQIEFGPFWLVAFVHGFQACAVAKELIKLLGVIFHFQTESSIVAFFDIVRFFPTTDKGWHEVESAAAVVAEAGNLLMMPGRSAGSDWDEYSVGLIDAGAEAMQAALDQDEAALFDAGGRIYQVCRACHNQYWVQVGADDE